MYATGVYVSPIICRLAFLGFVCVYLLTLIVHCIGNFLSVKPVDQQKDNWQWDFILGGLFWGQAFVYYSQEK